MEVIGYVEIRASLEAIRRNFIGRFSKSLRHPNTKRQSLHDDAIQGMADLDIRRQPRRFLDIAVPEYDRPQNRDLAQENVSQLMQGHS